MAPGDKLHLIKGAAVIRAAVGGDVVLHVGIGEPMVALLLGILADVPLYYRVQGIVLTHLLEMSLFRTSGVGSKLGKGFVHDDGAGIVVQLQRVLHVRILL